MDRENLIGLSLKYDGEYDKIVKAISNNEIVNEDWLKMAKGYDTITIFDAEYPKKLLNLKQPPMVLYYKGNLDLLKDSSIGITGTRLPTYYAADATTKLCTNTDKVVISGLAKGVDTFAHKYAKKTVAVLGCGIHYIYPLENRDLFKEVEEKGLILSEYPGLTKPLAYHFPFRNRIIAALSDELYVMEAKDQKSGTVGTVNYALDLGKNIKVLPFDAFADCYNNTLIAEGAMVITKKDLGV